MLALTFFGIIHVPINVPALGFTMGEDNVDVDRELKAHGLSNALSGACGSIQVSLAGSVPRSGALIFETELSGLHQLRSLCTQRRKQSSCWGHASYCYFWGARQRACYHWLYPYHGRGSAHILLGARSNARGPG